MFVGREEQLEQLKALWRKPVASLVTCRGRRRIGKSTLIEEFAKRSRVRFLKLEGLQPGKGVDNATQLAAFARQLTEQTGRTIETPKDWFTAFKVLAESLNPREKCVLLLDEISWMGKYDVNFPGELKYAWDNRFAKCPKLVMVLCGSVSSWIDKVILKSKAFVGRPALNLMVRELSIAECAAFWKRIPGVKCSARDFVDVLSVTGGVPKYLESIDPALSADENIRNLCYRPGGLLVDEFDDIFNDALDENLGIKKRILQLLADKIMSTGDLAEALGAEYNGHLTEQLKELVLAGFIAREGGRNPATDKPSNLVRYRVSDNYTRFYLKFIEPNRRLIERDAYSFVSLEQLPGWTTVLGLQFECLVLNNLRAVVGALGLQNTLILSAAPFLQQKTARLEKCQIDLLVQTKRSVYVVEVKRQAELGEKVVDDVVEKVRRLKVVSGKSVIAVLVYEGHLSKRVAADGYFGRILSIADLGWPES